MKYIKSFTIMVILFSMFLLTCSEEPEVLPNPQIEESGLMTSTYNQYNSTNTIFYGPKRFYSEGGSSDAITEYFNMPTCLEKEVLLIIDNGDGGFAVSSAVVVINDEVIFSQNDFNKKVTTLQSNNQLQPVNKLEITINGQPGSYFDISFSGAVENGLVACYPFDNNVIDESGNNKDGLLNGPVSTTDRYETAYSAYEFDGVNDYIDIPNLHLFDESQDYSLVAWINAYDFNTERKIISLRGERNMLFGTNINPGNATSQEEILFLIFDGNRNYVNAGTISLNTWHHVAATYSSTDGMRIYLDGQLIDSNGFTGIPTISTFRSNQIGAYVDTHFWKGKIDDVKIYNRTLSIEEIQSQYGLFEAI